MNLAKLLPPQQYRFYYNKLSRPELHIYDLLLSGILHGAKEIACYGCLPDQLQLIFRYITLDIPEVFFVKSIKIRYPTTNPYKCTVMPCYRFSLLQAHDTLITMSQECSSLLEKARGYNDFSKERVIHDYLAGTVAYKDVEAPYSHEAPGALLFHIGVCEGIAKAFKYLADRLGISSIVAFGDATSQGRNEPHAWNLVQVDGKFYHLDTTFDITLSAGHIRYDYFNLSDTDIRRTHRWNEDYPGCCQTDGLYEKMGYCFSSGKELAKYLHNACTTRNVITFKYPLAGLFDTEMIVPAISRFVETVLQHTLSTSVSYALSYNLSQMVFQLEFT